MWQKEAATHKIGIDQRLIQALIARFGPLFALSLSLSLSKNSPSNARA